MVAGTRVTISAGLSKVGRIDGRASIGRTENVVDAVAGCAVGDTLRTSTQRKAVIAIGERRDTIGGQIVAQGQTFIAVATSTGNQRYSRCVYQRSGFFRPKDKVLAVTVAAYGSTGQAVFHGLSVDTFVISFGDIGVALAARGRDIPVVHLGTGVP